MTDHASRIAPDAGRRRRLARLGGADRIVAGIALDHRDSLRVVLEQRGLRGLTTADLRRQKRALATALAPAATAIMLDAELGGAALEEGAVPASVGLIMPLEAQGYETADVPRASLLDDFSPAEAARYGADACKLLLPYRADDEATSAHHDALVRDTAEACHALGLPLVVEPLVSRRAADPADDWRSTYERLVVAAVERLRPLGVDLLKLPFPVPAGTAATPAAIDAALEALAGACGDTPWVLLGAGAELETLLGQIRSAGRAGASGFLVGRSIWGSLVRPDPDETGDLAATVGRAAFERCRVVADTACRPLPGAAAGPAGPAGPG